MIKAKKATKGQQKKMKRKLKGKGDYKLTGPQDAKAAIDDLDRRLLAQEQKKGLGSALGKKLGGLFGNSDLGSSIGNAAENTMAKLFGFGDYTISSNSLVKAAAQLNEDGAAMVPMFGSHGRGVRIQEREFLGDIVSGTLSGGATIFANQSFIINPADVSTFPWLSTFAQNFEQWEPHGIVFEFRSTSSEFNGTSQALGKVMMATDYDTYDNPYASAVEMETADYSNSTKPACSAMHGIECDPKERSTKLLFCGNGQSDQRMNNLGNFQLATQGCSTAGVTLGELWISYDITFYKKQLVYPVQMAGYQFQSTDPANPFTVPFSSPTAGLDTNPVLKGLYLTFNGLVVTLPPFVKAGQAYLIVALFTNAAGNSQQGSIASTANCTVGNSAFCSLSTLNMFSRASANVVIVTAPNPTVTFNNPVNVTLAKISIMRVDPRAQLWGA